MIKVLKIVAQIVIMVIIAVIAVVMYMPFLAGVITYHSAMAALSYAHKTVVWAKTN